MNDSGAGIGQVCDFALAEGDGFRAIPPSPVSPASPRRMAGLFMEGCIMRWRKLILGGLIVLAVLVVAGWTQRDRFVAWYYLRQLALASSADREAAVERVTALDGEVLPGLLRLLDTNDDRACDNARAALDRLTQSWPAADARWSGLLDRLAEDYAHRGIPGREGTLRLAAAWLERPRDRRPPALAAWAARLLAEVQRADDKEVDEPALDLAAALLALPDQSAENPVYRRLAQKGLASPDPEKRVRAVRLAMHPGINLLDEVTPLLNDPRPEVRRAAMLAVGPAAGAMPTDNLLPWLHDSDADVRRLCEAALLARSDFRPEHLPLARLITAPQPSVRLQVLRQLQRNHDLEPGIWLRRLSHDTAPEVRAAAVRAAAGQSVADLSDRLSQMAQSDPSPTVSQLARYYLQAARPR